METMNRETALARLHAIVHGIDKDHSDSKDGWWETGFGAEFGAARLRLLEDLLVDLTA